MSQRAKRSRAVARSAPASMRVAASALLRASSAASPAPPEVRGGHGAPAPAREALDLIGQLYAAEKDCASADDRRRIREQHSRDIVRRIQEWTLRQEALPRSPPSHGRAYMGDLWPGLLRFLDDPRLALDNNATERALRGVVIGRKNHFGSRSERRTEVAALFYSLIESAKLAGVEPDAYLRAAARQGIRGERILLPRELAAG
jgi:transposase